MIHLPDLFERKLSSDPSLATAIRQSLNLFEPWLEQSGMPFFPGFTDHSPRHINDVLNTAASLISDASHVLLSAEDVSVLCMSILLHDCGMHLTQDGFRALVTNSGRPVISGLGDLPWPQMWEDFLSEAHRFGQDRLVAIFGDAEPVRVDEINLDDLSERDCLLIGEFVRRHHSRLAHEIALTGVPIRNGTPLELIGLDAEYRDLAGLVARSHGMPIRATFPYIESKYSLLPEYRRVKSPYLMAILRIADYVQVQSERALKSLLSVKELRSPVSRQEWRNHFAVKDVSQRHEDPEALFVNAKPSDVRTYLKLDSLFKDIQRELDESWATLGEVYGRQGDLAKLGLTWRRIRSNLDEKEKFSRTVPYIPVKAGFDSSGPDLLKLLVGPLYDYKFEVGIRELIQNAVDACKELTDITTHRVPKSGMHVEAEVTVDIYENEDGTGWITVSDNGVGMTVDTITNYFLVAGASFRNSDVWKQQHTDESGQLRVMRGGRFGVGALAAFLLGDELSVRTRHVGRSESEGLEFTARIDDPVVELRRCQAPVGTVIKIWVSNPEIINKLRPWRHQLPELPKEGVVKLHVWPESDWFVQSSPRVACRWNGFDQKLYPASPENKRVRYQGEFQLSPEDYVPHPEKLAPGWQELNDPSPYKAILWQYRKPKKQNNASEEEPARPQINEITVNGVRIQEVSMYQEGGYVRLTNEAKGTGPDYSLLRPSMAIFDPAGICPINLQRSAVSFERMGLDENLSKAVLQEHFKKLLGPSLSCNSLADIKELCAAQKKQLDVHYSGQTVPICVTSEGLFLATPQCFSELKVRVLLSIDTNNVPNSAYAKLLNKGEAVLFRVSPSGIQNDLGWFRAMLAEDNSYGWLKRNTGLPFINRSAAVGAMPKKLWALANEKGRVNRQLLQSLIKVRSSTQHQIVAVGNVDEASPLISRVEELLTLFDEGSGVFAWKLTNNNQFIPPSLIHQVWIEMFGGPYIKPIGTPKRGRESKGPGNQKAI